MPDTLEPPARATTSREPVDLELVARLRVAVARLHRQLRQHSGSGLPLTRQSALVTIEQHGPLALGELAAVEQVAPATVTKIVGRLVDDGLVVRTVDPADRRSSRVALTEAGAQELADSRTRRNAYLARLLDQPDAPDLDAVARTADVLERLARPAGDPDGAA